MIIIDTIARWTGYVVLSLGFLTIISIILYSFYQFCLVRWAGVHKRKTRKYFYYFIKNEDEIKEYIDKKEKNTERDVL